MHAKALKLFKICSIQAHRKICILHFASQFFCMKDFGIRDRYSKLIRVPRRVVTLWSTVIPGQYLHIIEKEINIQNELNAASFLSIF